MLLNLGQSDLISALGDPNSEKSGLNKIIYKTGQNIYFNSLIKEKTRI